MSQFTYRPSPNISFIVSNTSGKQLRIFNYPLLPGQTRDLMKIPNIGEEDIRDSLLKGQLQFLFSTGQISIVSSDIDLSQFNPAQRQFLENLGITTYSTHDLKWSLQTNWFIDPINGNDQNSGNSSSLAIKTITEFMTRTGGVIRAGNTPGMTIQLVGSGTWPVTDSFRLIGLDIAYGHKLILRGTVSTLSSGTITAVTAINRATNTPYSITNSGLSASGFGTGVTSTGGFKKRFRIPTGARAGAIAWGVKDPGGAKTIRTSNWEIPGGSSVTPVVSDPYVIEQLTTIPDLVIDVNSYGQNDDAINNSVEIYDIALPISIFGASTFNSVTLRSTGWGTIAFFGCQVWHVLSQAQVANFDNCQLDHSNMVSGSVSINAGYGSGTIFCYPGSFVFIDGDYIRNYDDPTDNDAGNIAVVRGSALLTIGTAAGFDGFDGSDDGSNSGLSVEPGGTVRISTVGGSTHALYGANFSAYGVVVQSGGTISYDTNKPTITGTTGDSKIGGTAKAWSTVPFVNTTNIAKIVVTA